MNNNISKFYFNELKKKIYYFLFIYYIIYKQTKKNVIKVLGTLLLKYPYLFKKQKKDKI